MRTRWRFEACGYPSAPDISPKNIGVFIPGDLDGLVEGLTEIGEGGSDFGLYVPLRDSRENPAEGGAKIACGKIIAKEERRYSLPSLLSGLRFRFLLGMEGAQMQVAGAARGAALASIGKVKAHKLERSLECLDMEVSSELKDLSCKGSLAKGEALLYGSNVPA